MTTASDRFIPKQPPDKTTDGRSLRKVCAYFRVLAGHEVEGLRPVQIAQGVSVAAATVTRDMRVLADEGFVERVPGMEDRWRLGPKPIQLALAHMQGMERLTSRLNETKQRYSRDR